MAILKQRDDGDSTIFLTITSTSTMSNNIPQPTDSSENTVQIVSWVQQTSLRTLVTSAPITIYSTISPSTQPKATTVYVSHNNSNEPTDSSLPPSVVESSLDEPSSTTTRRIGSMSDIPSHSTFGDITSASSSNRSTQIGLAIGIPIAIFAIFFIALGIWYYIRSRKNKNKNQQFNFNDTYYKSRTSDETITPDKPYPVVFSPGVYLKQESNSQIEKPERKESTVKRLSKMFPVRNKDQEQSFEKPQEFNFKKRMSMMTPIFLRKFNLGKIEETQEDDIKPQVLTIDSEHKNQVPKVKNKLNLPPTIVLEETGLDPVRGGLSPQQSMYTVIRSYNKNLSDELNIEVGDKVVILEKHSDGWCNVKKIHMGKEYYTHQSSQTTGLVPRMCLQKI